eukprot:scaffold168252_cov36-Prasinocladus_malaysianus.AAC.1
MSCIIVAGTAQSQGDRMAFAIALRLAWNRGSCIRGINSRLPVPTLGGVCDQQGNGKAVPPWAPRRAQRDLTGNRPEGPLRRPAQQAQGQ